MGVPDFLLRPGDDTAGRGRRVVCDRPEPGVRTRCAHRRRALAVFASGQCGACLATRDLAPTGESPYCATRSSLSPTTRTCWRSTAPPANCAGRLRWRRLGQPYGGTVAPLIVNDLVIAGVAGADHGIRGFVAAFKAETGALVWRHWTVPRPGRARNRNLARQGAGCRGWFHVAYRLLRCVKRYALLAHRQSVA